MLAIHQSFETADLPMTLSIGNAAIWKRFWHVFGQPEYAPAPYMATNAQRRAKRHELTCEIQQTLRTCSRGEWLARFAEANVPAGPTYGVDEPVDDPHIRERSLFFAVPRNRKRMPQVGLAIQIDGNVPGYFQLPPRLGQHTEQIPSSILSLDDQTIPSLGSKRLIAGNEKQ